MLEELQIWQAAVQSRQAGLCLDANGCQVQYVQLWASGAGLDRVYAEGSCTAGIKRGAPARGSLQMLTLYHWFL